MSGSPGADLQLSIFTSVNSIYLILPAHRGMETVGLTTLNQQSNGGNLHNVT